MKILILETMYSIIEKYIYQHKPELLTLPYREQKEFFDKSYNYWGSSWCEVLKNNGYCAENYIINIEFLQQTWMKENYKNESKLLLDEIVLKQIKQFKPDVLWFDVVNESLLKEIRRNFPEIRLILGWVGSAIAKNKQWNLMDVIISCAPESVEKFRKEGKNAEHINHAFSPDILNQLSEKRKKEGIIFIGQILRGEEYHLQREKMLLAIEKEFNIKIYTPSFYIGYKDIIYCKLKQILYDMAFFMKKIDFEYILKDIPLLERAMLWEERPIQPINMDLKKNFIKPVFGLEMFRAIQNAEIVLNIHADSSPLYASNMRLFETTGMGSCLLTDQKENMASLFKQDVEVVTYTSTEDCVDKIKWLYEHPKKIKEIAHEGQKRCLKDHTFHNRVGKFEMILKKYMK